MRVFKKVGLVIAGIGTEILFAAGIIFWAFMICVFFSYLPS